MRDIFPKAFRIFPAIFSSRLLAWVLFKFSQPAGARNAKGRQLRPARASKFGQGVQEARLRCSLQRDFQMLIIGSEYMGTVAAYLMNSSGLLNGLGGLR